MDFNPINNNLHTPTHKLPIINNWEKEGFSIMDLEDHHPHPHQHHHHHHHHHQHENHHNHHHHISIHDPIWHTYHHNLPRSPPPPPIISSSSSSSSMMTIKQFPLLQEQILVENDDDELLLLGEEEEEEEEEEELGAMKEMMYRIAVMQPVDIDPASIRKPKRRNVRISNDPQSVAARHRRERISERIRILQRLVPGGTKMDTASMFDEAIRYVKFLKRQIRQLQLQQQQQQQPSSSNHHPPPVPALPPSDWPPSGSLVGPSGNSKAVLIRDKNNNNNNNNNHINEGMMVFQHGGN